MCESLGRDWTGLENIFGEVLWLALRWYHNINNDLSSVADCLWHSRLNVHTELILKRMRCSCTRHHHLISNSNARTGLRGISDSQQMLLGYVVSLFTSAAHHETICPKWSVAFQTPRELPWAHALLGASTNALATKKALKSKSSFSLQLLCVLGLSLCFQSWQSPSVLASYDFVGTGMVSKSW